MLIRVDRLIDPVLVELVLGLALQREDVDRQAHARAVVVALERAVDVAKLVVNDGEVDRVDHPRARADLLGGAEPAEDLGGLAELVLVDEARGLVHFRIYVHMPSSCVTRVAHAPRNARTGSISNGARACAFS